MNKRMVGMLVVGMCVVFSAQARLGWTKAQMEEKFGSPKTNVLEYVYKVDDLNKLYVMYEGDKAVLLRYVKYDSEFSIETEKRIVVGHNETKEQDVVTGYNLPVAVRYTEEEAKEILGANFPDAKWMIKPKAAPTGDTLVVIDQNYVGSKNIVEYRRYDGLVYAYLCSDFSPQLVIFAPTKLGVIKNLIIKQFKAVGEALKKQQAKEMKSKF